MINLEQVRLLETKVAKAIDYIERLTGENAALNQREAELQKKLESYQKRIDELEVLVTRFKEDQSQIEEAFFTTLDRLSRFEDAIEKCLSTGKIKSSASQPAKAPKTAKQPAAAQQNQPEEPDRDAVNSDGADGKICFEIPAEGEDKGGAPAPSFSEDDADVTDPLADTQKGTELDIF